MHVLERRLRTEDFYLQNMDDISVWNCLWILLTALIWGGTNPLLRQGAKGIDVIGEKEESDGIKMSDKSDNSSASDRMAEGDAVQTFSVVKSVKTAFREIKWCLMNWKLTLPFAVNQSGSVLFYYRSVGMSMINDVGNLS